MHIFWVAGLLLALIEVPDFGGWLGRIAGAVEKIAGIKPGQGAAEALPDHAVRDAPPIQARMQPHGTAGRSGEPKERRHA